MLFEKREKRYTFQVAGYTKYQENIIVMKNEGGEKISLVPEPNNKYDKNAIKVMYGRKKIGYVPKTSNRIVGDYIYKNQIQEINVSFGDAELEGGEKFVTIKVDLIIVKA